MICPKCRAEYREGYTHCRDCDEDLVESLPDDASRNPIFPKNFIPAHVQLTELITGMSDEDLISAVEEEYDNYTRKALDMAQQELRRRNRYFVDKSMFFPPREDETDPMDSVDIPTLNPLDNPTGTDNRPDINTHLTMAVLTTLFCCSPIGMAGIYFAGKAQSRFETGDLKGALAYSNEARKWCWTSFWIGLAVIGLFLLAQIHSR